MTTAALSTAHSKSDRPRRFVGLFSQRFVILLLGIGLPLFVYALFVGYPIIYNVYLSLTRWNGLSPRIDFVGLSNYRQLPSDRNFYLSLLNTLQWAGISLIIHVVLGMAVAIALFSGRMYFPTLFRSLLFLPVTMSLVAVTLMFSLILSPGFGVLDQTLHMLGLESFSRAWLGDYSITLYILIFIDAWAYFGVPLMLFHAGLGNIDKEQFEAARLDGANGLQIAWHVIVPNMRPVVLIVTMLSIIHSLKAFDVVSVMTRGGPAGGTNVLGYYMYVISFWRNQFGYGAAIAVVMLILSIGFAFGYLRNVAKDTLHVDS
jgi:ABC-type sugar transport system permease subunit